MSDITYIWGDKEPEKFDGEKQVLDLDIIDGKLKFIAKDK